MFNANLIKFILNYMDIRDFYKSNQNKSDSNQTNPSQSNSNYNEFSNKQSTKDFSEYQDTINKYKDLSQSELYNELLNQASNLKSQGKLDNNTLNTISNTLSPMLNDEQKQLLNDLLEKIK